MLMETLNYTLPEFKLSEPDMELLDFCARYSREEAQQKLWKWFILALKDSQANAPAASTTELIAFYEQLKKLLSAVYQLHDLDLAPRSLHREEEAQKHTAPQPASLAEALDTLHHTVSHDWILLICPPE